MTHLKTKARNNSAFTLLEALFGAILLVAVLTASLSFFNSFSNINESNCNSTIAINHLNYVLEDIRRTPYSDRKTLIDSGAWDWNSSQINTKGLGSLLQENINAGCSGPTDNLHISVTSDWKDRANRPRSMSLHTLMVSYN
jgi:hypothetical protein